MAAGPRTRTTLLLAAAATALFLAPPAESALPTPIPTTPASGAVGEFLPPFAWSPVAGATSYEFQVAADRGMNSPVLGRGEDQFATRNARATLKKTVPNGTYWWRVRALKTGANPSAWSVPRSFRKAWTAAATLQSPAHGSIVSFPETPLTLRWSVVPRAAKYFVYLATDPTLGSIVGPKDVETAGTSYTPRSTLLPPGTYYWAVVPVDAQGHRGAASPTATFTWVWLTGTSTFVTDVAFSPEVYDPQFSWGAVPGAARYEVEINPSVDFAPGSKVCCSGTSIGTSLSPQVLFRDNTYYWRVRALDANGNAGVWNYGAYFTKVFDKSPPVTGPAIKSLRMRDNVGDPGTDTSGTAGYQTQVPILVWDPVPGASSYSVDIAAWTGGICNWSLPEWRVTTSLPSWTPLGSGWNNSKPYPDAMQVATDLFSDLTAGASYCARVRARTDRDSTGQDVYGDFTYLDDGTGPAFTFTGYPTGRDCGGCAYLAASDYLLPAHGTIATRTPLFTWTPLQGKQSYFVLVSKDPSFTNLVDYAFTQVPAYSPRSSLKPTTYADETTSYYWAVLPATEFSGNLAAGNPLAASARAFQKQSTPPTLLGPVGAASVSLQPSFRWTGTEGARRYRLQVSVDQSFGTLLDDVTTTSTAYTAATSYPADTLLYWRVRTDDENLIGLTWSLPASFKRTLPTPSPSVANAAAGEGIPVWSWDPITGAVSYDVAWDEPDGDHSQADDFRSASFTFIKMTGTGVWGWRVRANFPKASTGVVPGPWSGTRSFTRTIAEPGGARTEASPTHLLLSWSAKPGAKNYRVQISQRADFVGTVEDVTTDSTAYAPQMLLNQYTAGGSFWWRVAAMDEDRNQGDFSPAQRFDRAKAPSSGAALARMRLGVRVLRVKGGRRVRITVTTTARKPLRLASVRALGVGVRPGTLRTNRFGRATFVLRPSKRMRILVFRVSKKGYLPAQAVLRVRR